MAKLNKTTCRKYPCACVMPERYFVFKCCSANASTRASTGKSKNFDPCAVLMPASRPLGRLNGEIRVIVLALVLGSLVTRLYSSVMAI